ncbi:protease Do (Precursor), related [Neospora caninum Liverpool]|uniref:Protease Do (Precursor), related n=1 Tax=Neospora caninum (strain Liverpool) TaxID=572307 RepID=F0VAG6_NEOCL|nr:protease Do (Precursor), related [Neospora caninum Liverpool]CBZ50655.1 protease Do (Precursor), related [Neospora caninum Liverpool]|eukprot:XP_003880688.1 protease Do (Precursor), related [Neospora caninum Liverpool]
MHVYGCVVVTAAHLFDERSSNASSSSEAASVAGTETVSAPLPRPREAPHLSNVSPPPKPGDGKEEEVVYVVKMNDGQLLWGDFRGKDTRSDVAVLRLRAPHGDRPLCLPSVSLHSPVRDRRRGEKTESPYRPRLGEFVVAVGTTYYGDEPVGACGIVSQPCQSFSALNAGTNVGFIQLGVITLPGMSGSLVANMRGEVVGMVVKKFQDYGLALPIHFVTAVCDQLDATGHYQAPSLGLVFQQPASLADVAAFASSEDTPCIAPREQHLRVDSVVPGSPAEKAGIQKRDVVVAADGSAVCNLHALFDFILSRAPGEAVVLDVLRANIKRTCKVILSPPAGPAGPPG